MVGVSADSTEIQHKFIEKFGLTFPMISDTSRTIIDAYGARAVLGITAARSTFVVDPDGLIAHVWPKVIVDGHADDVVDRIRTISGGRRDLWAT